MAKVAVIQMTSAPDVEENLACARALLERAAAAGADLAALPENFAIMGLHERDKLGVAEALGTGPIQAWLGRTARELNLWIIGGTIPLRTADESKVAPASLVFDAQGRIAARYDKIHLFDVDLPGRDESYRESATILPGNAAVTVETPVGRVGLAVCYDMRFPELFRELIAQGATAFSVPSAFTVPTGQAHWEVLLRARAIENLSYVFAPAQWGTHRNGRKTFGNALIVDPWGEVLARAADGAGFAIACIDPDAQSDLRRRFPALSHRRLQ